MTCNEAREAMLIVDPAQLQTHADTALGAHLRECSACRALAQRLGLQLTVLRTTVRRRSRRRLLTVTVAAGLPIAAGVIASVSMSRAKAMVEVRPPTTASISVDVQPGQQATVINTKDPKVTIVWVAPAEGL